MPFEFFTAGRIHFACGAMRDPVALLEPLGKCFLVVLDDRIHEMRALVESVSAALEKAGCRCVPFGGVYGEPQPETVDAALAVAREHKCDAVLAIGGGSVMDTGKAAAGLIHNEGSIVDYLEGVGIGRNMVNDPVPFIAVPTTAGTGAEVTKNAVITSHKPAFKKSFRSEKLLAKLVILDPELTLSLPAAQTAASGMDALTQLIESYTSVKANPLTDGLAMEGMRLAAHNLAQACAQGDDIKARSNMMIAATMSGICLANAGLGAAHGIAAALGAHVGIGHGLACAILLPHVMALNVQVLPERFSRIAQIFTGRQDPEAAIDFVKELNARIGIPADLKGFAIDRSLLPALARDSAGGSMSGNPIQLTQEEWVFFLEKIC